MSIRPIKRMVKAKPTLEGADAWRADDADHGQVSETSGRRGSISSVLLHSTGRNC